MRNFLFVLLIALILFVPVTTQAINIIEPPEGCQNIECLILSFIDFIFNIALVIVPIFLIIAGFFFVMAMGDPEKIQRAKNIITWALVGLVIIIMGKGIVAVFKEIFEL